MKKKVLAMLLAVATVTCSLTGCMGLGGGNKDQKNDTEENSGEIDYNAEFELRMISGKTDDASVALFEEAATRLKEKWPNVTVVNESTTDAAQKMKMAFSSGQGYDLVYVDDLSQQMLAENDYLMDITDDVLERGWIDQSVEGAVEFNNLRTPGKYYSVPFLMAPVMVYYNKDIFAELNLEIPKTLEEFEAVMQTVADAGYIAQEICGEFFYNPIWMASSMILNEAPKEEIDDWYYVKDASDNVKTAFINAFEKLVEWQEKGYFRENYAGVTQSDSFSLFGQGKTAMMLDGDWDQRTIEMTGLNIGAFAFPGMEEGTPYVINATDGAWALNKELDATKKAACLDWIDIFFEKDYLQGWYESGFTLSVTVDTSEFEATTLHREVADAAEDSKLGFYLDNVKPGFLDLWVKEFQLLMLGENTPESTWDNLNTFWSEE